MISIFLVALQAATPSAAPVPQRFSILVPIGDQACGRKAGTDEIIVCANALPDQKLPYPDEVAPDRPVASNPELSARRALAVEGTPCAASQHGCTVGFGAPLVDAALRGATDLAKDLFAKKPDKRGRVAIPMDDPAPGQ